jgi:hypothetical protein
MYRRYFEMKSKKKKEKPTTPKKLMAEPVGYTVEVVNGQAVWTYTGELKGHVSEIQETPQGRKFFIVPTRRIYLDTCEEVWEE